VCKKKESLCLDEDDVIAIATSFLQHWILATKTGPKTACPIAML